MFLWGGKHPLDNNGVIFKASSKINGYLTDKIFYNLALWSVRLLILVDFYGLDGAKNKSK
jgi:hypothetical protein